MRGRNKAAFLVVPERRNQTGDMMQKIDLRASAVVTFSTLLGLGIRLAIVARSSFPLNDGGLFYAMINDLLASQFRLPAFTSYNAAGIPFAYPPLAFYLYALVHLVSSIPVTRLMLIGPALVSTASIPLFYLLAHDVTQSARLGALATVVFALLPRAFDWTIMGGGVTRSLGMVFALLAMRAAYHVFVLADRREIVPLALFGSLAVYSHPEAAVHTTISAIVFYLWKDRSLRGLASALEAAAGAVVLTSPWWGTILAQHGPGPLLSAVRAARVDSIGPLGAFLSLLRFDFADEPFIGLLTVFGLIGVAFEISHRRYLFGLWLLAMGVLEPRGAPTFMMIPLAMGAGTALESVILPALAGARHGATQAPTEGPVAAEDWFEALLQPASTRWFMGLVLAFSAISAYAVGWRVQEQLTLKADDLQALEWVRSHTDPQSRFALVTQQLPFRDATSEWFPALTGRQSVATVFGYEWLDGADFARRIAQYQGLQACAQQDIECLGSWEMKYGSTYDYLYISDPAGFRDVALATFLARSPQAEILYQSPTVDIYMIR